MEDHHFERGNPTARITALERSVQELDRKIAKLTERADSLTSKDKDEIRSLQMRQEDVKIAWKELMKRYRLLPLDIDQLLEGIVRIEAEEQNLNIWLYTLLIRMNIYGDDSVSEEEEENYTEAIREGGTEPLGVKIGRLLELVCCCFMPRESKNHEEEDSVNKEVQVGKSEDLKNLKKEIDLTAPVL